MPTNRRTSQARRARQPKSLEDDPSQLKPSLRISSIVRGREKRGNRVFYCVDPEALEGRKAVAESVVLTRWRQRKMDGLVFRGFRIGPHLWRDLAHVLPGPVSEWPLLSLEEIDSAAKAQMASKPANRTDLPPSACIQSLLGACGSERLPLIISRHTDPSRVKKFGTPDLFLYAEEKSDGKLRFARFVEVKKPEEPLSKDQIEELEWLQSIGLPARVLRLIERAG